MTQPNPTPPGDPAPTTEPTTPPAPPADPAPTAGDPPADEPLREPGKRALDAERARVKALEQQLQRLAPLEQLAAMLGGSPTGDGKTDLDRLTERVQQYETDLTAERQARWRAEIAAETGLPPGLAARLQGGTREEMAADAAVLKELLPPAGPRNPAPDPSQGTRGTQPPDLDALITEAQKAGDVRKVIALQKQKLANVQR